MLELLRDITDAMTAAASVQEALDALVWHVCDALNSEVCAVYLHDEHNQAERLVAIRYLDGLNQEQCLDQTLTSEWVHQVVAQRRPLSILNSPELDIEPGQPCADTRSFRAFLGVPIIYQNQIYGVLLTQRLQDKPYSDSDEAFVVTLAAQVAATVAHGLKSGGFESGTSEKEESSLTLTGQGAVSGVALGKSVVVYPLADFDSITERPSDNIEADLDAFEAAIKAVADDIHAMEVRLADQLGQAEQALFMAYGKILESDRFGGAVKRRIKSGEWVQSALKFVLRENVKTFEAMEDEYLSERANDVRDLARRVLSYLQQQDQLKPKSYPTETILVGPDITASMLAEVPAGRLKAVVSGTGSSNSHVAILASALGVPTVMGVDSLPTKGLDGITMVVDGYAGRLFVRPNKTLHDAYVHLAAEEQELQVQLKQLVSLAAETSDAHAVALMANVSLISDTNPAQTVKADGVGLYRSEVPFMMRERFPSEEEQRVIYRQILQAFKESPVTMRTLDAGADKALPYFQFEEENPFLGWRGIRMMIDHPDIFLTQIRAMLRASEGLNNLKIMLPMIATSHEIEISKSLIQQAYDSLQHEGVVVKMPQIGAMIEVPSTLYQLDEILALTDFISVGSNDLVQYLMAADRGNPRVANYYDPYHPAFLRVLQQVAKAAAHCGKAASICGELAGDPLATIMLIGMGYGGLSMASSSILRVKWVLRSFSFQDCQMAVEAIMKLQSSHEVKAALSERLIDAGLGGLIRAGKY